MLEPPQIRALCALIARDLLVKFVTQSRCGRRLPRPEEHGGKRAMWRAVAAISLLTTLCGGTAALAIDSVQGAPTAAISGIDWAPAEYGSVSPAAQAFPFEAPALAGADLGAGSVVSWGDPRTRLADEPGARGAIFLGYSPFLSARLDADAGLANRRYDEFLSSAFNLSSTAPVSGNFYAGADVALRDDLKFRFGEIDRSGLRFGVPDLASLAGVGRPQYFLDREQTEFAGLDWDFASWAGFGMAAAHNVEQDSAANSLALSKPSSASSIGVSAHVAFGNGWVTTFSYNVGIEQLSLKSNALSANSDETLHSRAYGLTVAKHGLFGNDDSLGLAVTRPLEVYAGIANGISPDGFDPAPRNLGSAYLSLGDATPETDLELGYVTTFMDGALALQANAGYQMNVAGVTGSNALSVISRAKINF